MHLLMVGFTATIATMLVVYMHSTTFRRFEGYRTDSALIEDLTMLLLNVTLQEGQGHEKHFTMQTPERNLSTSERVSENNTKDIHSLREEVHLSSGHNSRYLRVPNCTGKVETILFHMLLDVHWATECPTFRTAIRRFVWVNALMGPVAALVG